MQSIIRTIRNKYVSIHGNYWSTIWPVASGAGGPGGDGDGTSAPPFFAKQVNLSQPGGQIMPTTVLR